MCSFKEGTSPGPPYHCAQMIEVQRDENNTYFSQFKEERGGYTEAIFPKQDKSRVIY